MGASVLEQKSFASRFVIPAGTVLLISLVMYFTHKHLWQVVSPDIHRPVALLVGLGTFFMRFLTPLIIYPWAYFKGASLGERILAGLTPTLAWLVVEFINTTAVFSVGESLYYLLGPVFMNILFMNFSLMALAEFLCRLKTGTRRAGQKLVSPMMVLAFLSGPGATWLMLIWGGGVHWFYIYQAGYKVLFH